MESKKDVRKAVRLLAAGEDSAALWERVQARQEFKEAGRILIYMALPDEVPTQEFIDRWAGTKEFVIPVVRGEELGLRAYDPACLKTGAFGILEPSESAREVKPGEIDLALVPGVAFDRKCMRLGRGKGFYDRLLPQMDCYKIGIAHGWAVLDEVPVDPWDAPLNAVASPLEYIEL